jgi:hypothetical protein
VARRPPKGFASWSEYYQHRIAQGEARGLTRSQARGHPKQGEIPASRITKSVMITGPRGTTEVELAGFRARSRAAVYDNNVQALLQGRMRPSTFDRRWRGKTIDDITLPSANQVIALSLQGFTTFDEFYPGRLS